MNPADIPGRKLPVNYAFDTLSVTLRLIRIERQL